MAQKAQLISLSGDTYDKLSVIRDNMQKSFNECVEIVISDDRARDAFVDHIKMAECIAQGWLHDTPAVDDIMRALAAAKAKYPYKGA